MSFRLLWMMGGPRGVLALQRLKNIVQHALGQLRVKYLQFGQKREDSRDVGIGHGGRRPFVFKTSGRRFWF